MHTDEYEKAFEDFLLGEVYEQNENDPFALARAAFQAGWRALSARAAYRSLRCVSSPTKPEDGFAGLLAVPPQKLNAKP